MLDGKFYTRDSEGLIRECRVNDIDRIITEYGFVIDEEDIAEGTLSYYNNGKIYCCSWYDSFDMDGVKIKAFEII